MKKCPFCAESIQDDAVICRYCGRDVPPVRPEQASTSAALYDGSGIIVPTKARPFVPLLATLGGALIVIGSFMPWLVVRAPFVGSVSKGGLEGGDGVITLIVGILVALAGLGVYSTGSNRLRLFIFLGTVAIVVLGVFDYQDVQGRINDAQIASSLISGSVGAGLYVIFVGAGFALVSLFAKPRTSS